MSIKTKSIKAQVVLSVIVCSLLTFIVRSGTTFASGEIINKTVTNLTTGSTTQANPGDILRWVVDYYNGDGSNNSIDLLDVIDPNTTYVPGSLEVPELWEPMFSSDGTTFSVTSEPSTVLGVGAHGTNLAVPATALTAGNALPPSSMALSATGGDGYYPVAYSHSSGKTVLFNIFHYDRSNLTTGIGGKTVTRALFVPM